MRNIVRIAALAGSIVASAGPMARSEVPDRALIHDVQKAYWDSISDLRLTGTERPLDRGLTPVRGRGVSHNAFTIAHASGGKWSFRRINQADDGPYNGFFQFREDGRATYGIVAFPENPDAIDQVIIRNQVDTTLDYKGEMCIALWAWIPGGKPIHAWMEEGAALAAEAIEGREAAVLRFQSKNHEVRCELDPEHDWLPRRIEMPGFFAYETRGFSRENGHWFPSDVVEILDENSVPPGSDTRSGFTLETLAINRGIAGDTFGMPKVGEGTYVRDERNWSGYVQGGIEARKRLDKVRDGSGVESKSPRDLPPTDVVAGDPPHPRWDLVLIGLSGVAVVLAWWLRRVS